MFEMAASRCDGLLSAGEREDVTWLKNLFGGGGNNRAIGPGDGQDRGSGQRAKIEFGQSFSGGRRRITQAYGVKGAESREELFDLLEPRLGLPGA